MLRVKTEVVPQQFRRAVHRSKKVRDVFHDRSIVVVHNKRKWVPLKFAFAHIERLEWSQPTVGKSELEDMHAAFWRSARGVPGHNAQLSALCVCRVEACFLTGFTRGAMCWRFTGFNFATYAVPVVQVRFFCSQEQQNIATVQAETKGVVEGRESGNHREISYTEGWCLSQQLFRDALSKVLPRGIAWVN